MPLQRTCLTYLALSFVFKGPTTKLKVFLSLSIIQTFVVELFRLVAGLAEGLELLGIVECFRYLCNQPLSPSHHCLLSEDPSHLYWISTLVSLTLSLEAFCFHQLLFLSLILSILLRIWLSIPERVKVRTFTTSFLFFV